MHGRLAPAASVHGRDSDFENPLDCVVAIGTTGINAGYPTMALALQGTPTDRRCAPTLAPMLQRWSPALLHRGDEYRTYSYHSSGRKALLREQNRSLVY
jgi:hypothetical protein